MKERKRNGRVRKKRREKEFRAILQQEMNEKWEGFFTLPIRLLGLVLKERKDILTINSRRRNAESPPKFRKDYLSKIQIKFCKSDHARNKKRGYIIIKQEQNTVQIFFKTL